MCVLDEPIFRVFPALQHDHILYARRPAVPSIRRVLGINIEVREGDTIDGLAAEIGLPKQALLIANKGELSWPTKRQQLLG